MTRRSDIKEPGCKIVCNRLAFCFSLTTMFFFITTVLFAGLFGAYYSEWKNSDDKNQDWVPSQTSNQVNENPEMALTSNGTDFASNCSFACLCQGCGCPGDPDYQPGYVTVFGPSNQTMFQAFSECSVPRDQDTCIKSILNADRCAHMFESEIDKSNKYKSSLTNCTPPEHAIPCT